MKMNDVLNEHIVNAFKYNDKMKYAKQVWDILQQSYIQAGGFKSSSSVEELVDDSGLWKITTRGNDVTSVTIYKDRFGRKAIASGTNGTDQGKQDYRKTKDEDIKLRRSWAEVSGAPERIMQKAGAKPLPAKFAAILTGKHIQEYNEDGVHYTRLIAGHPHEKIIYGSVNVTPELEEKLKSHGIKVHELPDHFIRNRQQSTKNEEYVSNLHLYPHSRKDYPVFKNPDNREFRELSEASMSDTFRFIAFPESKIWYVFSSSVLHHEAIDQLNLDTNDNTFLGMGVLWKGKPVYDDNSYDIEITPELKQQMAFTGLFNESVNEDYAQLIRHPDKIHRYPIFKNPSTKEIRDILTNSLYYNEDFRFIADSRNKTWYAFSSDITHAYVASKLGFPVSVLYTTKKVPDVFLGIGKMKNGLPVYYENFSNVDDTPELRQTFAFTGLFSVNEEYIDMVIDPRSKLKIDHPVFKNPTRKELKEIIETSLHTPDYFRFIADSRDNSWYAFSSDLLHADVLKIIGITNPALYSKKPIPEVFLGLGRVKDGKPVYHDNNHSIELSPEFIKRFAFTGMFGNVNEEYLRTVRKNQNNIEYPVFVNPSSKELREIMKDSNHYKNDFRFIAIPSTNTWYAFSADVLHETVITQLDLPVSLTWFKKPLPDAFLGVGTMSNGRPVYTKSSYNIDITPEFIKRYSFTGLFSQQPKTVKSRPEKDLFDSTVDEDYLQLVTQSRTRKPFAVYKNPNMSDIKDILKHSEMAKDSFRFIADAKTKTWYGFSAEILHEDVITDLFLPVPSNWSKKEIPDYFLGTAKVIAGRPQYYRNSYNVPITPQIQQQFAFTGLFGQQVSEEYLNLITNPKATAQHLKVGYPVFVNPSMSEIKEAMESSVVHKEDFRFIANAKTKTWYVFSSEVMHSDASKQLKLNIDPLWFIADNPNVFLGVGTMKGGSLRYNSNSYGIKITPDIEKRFAFTGLFD